MPQKESRCEQFKWIIAECCTPCLLICLYLGYHFYVYTPPYESFTFHPFKSIVSFISNILNNRKSK